MNSGQTPIQASLNMGNVEAYRPTGLHGAPVSEAKHNTATCHRTEALGTSTEELCVTGDKQFLHAVTLQLPVETPKRGQLMRT